jgi:uncharacterized membrane protein HdeD (DUF308 family)
MIQAFLLGVLATMFLAASLFFVRFWLETRDSFFLAFAASFTVEGLSPVVAVFQPKPSESSPWIYVVRLLAMLLILAAILKKNYEGND